MVFQISLSVFPKFLGVVALSQSLSYLSGLVWSYFWNRKWSFRSKGNLYGEFNKFVILQICLLLLSASVISLLVDFIGLSEKEGWIIVMFFITIINFTLLKLWVFKPVG